MALKVCLSFTHTAGGDRKKKIVWKIHTKATSSALPTAEKLSKTRKELEKKK